MSREGAARAAKRGADPAELPDDAVGPESLVVRRVSVILGVGATLTCAVLLAALLAPRYGWLTQPVRSVTADHAGQATTTTTVDASSGRDLLLKIATGIGVVTVGLLAWARLDMSRRDQQLAVRASNRSDRALINEQFARLVEQLGSPEPAIRLGSLHALRRFGHDSVPDRRVVVDIVSAWLASRRADMPAPRDILAKDIDEVEALRILLAVPEEWEVPALVAGRTIDGRLLHLPTLPTGPRLAHVTFSESTLANVWVPCAAADLRFSNSELCGVEFSSADVEEVSFTGTETLLRDVRFRGRLSHSGFGENVTLKGVTFYGLTHVDFDNCRLDDVFFDGTVEHVTFHDAVHFDGARFGKSCRLEHVQFVATSVEGVSFTSLTRMNGVLLPDGAQPGEQFELRPDGRWYSRAA